MIKQLILKDMMLQRKLSFVYLICLFFLSIVDFRSDSFLMTFIMFIPVLGMMLSMSYEDRNKSEMIINSLPFQRKEIVIAKYIFVSILVTLGGVFSLVVSLIQLQNENTTAFMLWGEILGGITGGLVYSIIVLPIEFSVGYSSAKQIAPFIGIAFGYLSGLIVSNVWLDVENVWNTSLVVNSCFIAGLLLLYVMSMLLSINLYNERDL
ncbi:ABC transporter permease [Bacillus thuringiensis]|uniref:ABC-2 transporter family protein n=5 Tax=Bacillus cereus group TaxID=86661 RepID=A0AAN0SW24_BACCE|nr:MULTISPECIES: ABC-2 transporter permease [Bacillus]COE14230.1 ABC-type transport system involved in multi-copper enzyme maturation%2C permease component [Streptococcus pneumoniae]AAT62838.1 ABC transporter, permease [[Bacillus thuringiensis] serovar konkukian str. 97-27]ABK87046.1 ABC transporter, permease component [Bacillus thuringiensis str. Al Hakam]ACO26810.1 putative membrane protein [Bacillus cereus 03BB102]AJG52645.1 ABC-2 transporter family protein [Bacillus cereus 03BB102]